MKASAESLLGPGGALASAIPGYEARPGQLAMARAVERALDERRYLMAEAGTGTGKTLAYLVPVALSGRKVIISTATKALQEQIFFKDVPLLRTKLGLKLEAAYLKGRANYLCAHRFEAFDRAPLFATPDEADLWPSVRTWALSTQSGDRAELDVPEDYLAWRQLSTTSDACLGTRCPLYDPCFVTQARRRAEAADVVVVNHHLFFADLALRARGGEAVTGVLPPYDAVVFDEAHALEHVATDYFGSHVSSFRLEELAADALAALPPEDGRAGMVSAVALSIRGRADALFQAAGAELGLRSGEGGVRLSPASFRRLGGNVDALGEALAAMASLTAADDEPKLQALRRRSGELVQELEFIRSADSPDHVFWAEARGRGVFFRAAPIDVGRELREKLYGVVDTAVFTSATLTAAGRFDFFARRVGLAGVEELPRRVDAVAVGSPFDYPRQAGLYLPTHLPEPSDPAFAEAAAQEIATLAALTGGRAFALFTSLRQMAMVHRLARPRLPFQVLLQGERPKGALLEAFRAEPSVLFAAHSFWEGVDVPGEALSLVIIDRLPFASPGEPVVAARIDRLRARGEEPFSSYQVPEAAIALRQGFGRLIRTRTDRGIVAVLDRRLTTRSYGRTFLDSLPKTPRFSRLGELQRWWATRSP